MQQIAEHPKNVTKETEILQVFFQATLNLSRVRVRPKPGPPVNSMYRTLPRCTILLICHGGPELKLGRNDLI
jgi:hypothetical protein